MTDKIRILLLDDNPESLLLKDGESVIPSVPNKYAQYYEVLWLATAEEARKFRDEALAIASVAPELMEACGIVPELIVFDYDLLKDPTPVEKRPTVVTSGYLQPEDVFLALFPSPGGEPWIQKSLSSTYSAYLRRLKSTDMTDSIHSRPENVQNLCVVVGDILDGKVWKQQAGRPENEWTYGLLPGEKYILRRYALENELKGSDGSDFLNVVFG
jgi:hypothetical protein